MTSAEPVVVGVDGSEGSRRALRWAADYAALTGSPLEALTAWQVPATFGFPVSFDDVDLKAQAEETLHAVIQDVCGDRLTVTERVERGHAGDVLVAASEHAQLLVVGSHGHNGVAGLVLGSVSQHCVHHAHCPVLVARDH